MTIVIVGLGAHVALVEESVRIDDEGGAPLRCCLRDSRVGERVRIGALAPPGPAGAYRETGPVFLHDGGCDGPASDGYPDAFRGRAQVFRAYDRSGQIRGGRLVEPGHGQEEVAAEIFADPYVAFVHSRNVVFGCYMFAMYRREDVAPAPAGTVSGADVLTREQPARTRPSIGTPRAALPLSAEAHR